MSQPNIQESKQEEQQQENKKQNNEKEMFNFTNKQDNYIPQIDTIDIDSSTTDGSQSISINNKGTTSFQAFSSLVKAGIGTGLLFTPIIIKQCGFIIAFLTLVIIPFVIYLSYMNLIHVLNNLQDNKMTMLQAVLKIFNGGSDSYQIKKNKAIRLFSQSCIFIFNLGGNVAFFILVMNSLGLFLKTEEDQKQFGDTWTPNMLQRSCLSLFIIFPIYYPFSLKDNLGDLYYFNLFGLFINGLTYILIMLNSLYLIFSGQNNSLEQQQQNSDSDQEQNSVLYSILLNFGIIMYLFDINGVISDVRGQMKEPFQFQGVLKKYLIFISSISFIIGSLGYIGYGDNTQANFFSNLHSKGILSGYGDILAGFYSLSLIINAVLYAYPIHQLMDKRYISSEDESMLDREQQQQITPQSNQKIKKHMVRLSVFLLQIVLAIVFPNIESVVSILGCVFSVCLGFVIPYILYQRYFDDNSHLNRPVKNLYARLVLGFGLVLGFLGLIATLN